MDEAVQMGMVHPGRYLILDFDFSRVNRSRSMNQSAEAFKAEIHLGLWKFKRQYTDYLGPSFASETSDLRDNPSVNLARLIEAVNFALQDIHRRGEKNNPLWDVKGV